VREKHPEGAINSCETTWEEQGNANGNVVRRRIRAGAISAVSVRGILKGGQTTRTVNGAKTAPIERRVGEKQGPQKNIPSTVQEFAKKMAREPIVMEQEK